MAVAMIGFLLCQAHYEALASREDVSTIGDLPERIELFDDKGRFYGALPWGSTRHSVHDPTEIPRYFVDALLIMEDRTFFEHGGTNWRGLARALLHDARHLSLKHGGSSVTEQLSKLWIFGIPKHEGAWTKIDRKLLEWQLAKCIESKFSKDQILLHYLNRIDFGGGFHGIYAASEGFFGKEPKNLTLLEAATLVAILRGPGVYSPILHPDRCTQRRNLVLREMAKAGKITSVESDRLAAMPLITKEKEWDANLRKNKEIRLVAKELKKAGIPREVLAKGGLKVTLTIDGEWNERCATLTQAHLQRIDPRIPNRPLEAAVLVIETRTGAIKALQSGRDNGDSFDRVFQSRRQVGSTAKPFLYELAFEQGMAPDRLMRNDDIAPGELWPGVKWSPKNTGDVGPLIPCRDGLIYSQNRVTARVGAWVGLPVFGEFLDRLGVSRKEKVEANPSSLIGAFEARLVDTTRAYTIFPLEGYECPKPHVIESVQSIKGELMFRSGSSATSIADPNACRITSECLREVFTKGTAKSAVNAVSPKAIGKTGSTNGAKDSWFVGADENFTCGVWVGCDTPTPLSGGSGAKFALPLWWRVMNCISSRNQKPYKNYGRASFSEPLDSSAMP